MTRGERAAYAKRGHRWKRATRKRALIILYHSVGKRHLNYRMVRTKYGPLAQFIADQDREAAKALVAYAYSTGVLTLAQWSRMTWKINTWKPKEPACATSPASPAKEPFESPSGRRTRLLIEGS